MIASFFSLSNGTYVNFNIIYSIKNCWPNTEHRKWTKNLNGMGTSIKLHTVERALALIYIYSVYTFIPNLNICCNAVECWYQAVEAQSYISLFAKVVNGRTKPNTCWSTINSLKFIEIFLPIRWDQALALLSARIWRRWWLLM